MTRIDRDAAERTGSTEVEVTLSAEQRAEEALRRIVGILAREAAREWFEASCAAAARTGLGERAGAQGDAVPRELSAAEVPQPIMGRPAGSARSSGRKPMKR